MDARRSTPRSSAVVVVVAALLATGGGAHAATDYRRVRASTAGISFLVPDDWVVDRGIDGTRFSAQWPGPGAADGDRRLVVGSTRRARSVAQLARDFARQPDLRGVEIERAKVADRSAFRATMNFDVQGTDGLPLTLYAEAFIITDSLRSAQMLFVRSRADDPEFDAMVATMVDSVRALR